MKIAVDVKPVLSRRTGIGRYTHRLLQEMLSQEGPHEYFLFAMLAHVRKSLITGRTGAGSYDQAVQRLARHFKIPFPFRKLVRVATDFYLPWALRRLQADVFWGTNYFGVFGKGFRTVINIHDMAHVRYPGYAHPEMARQLAVKLSAHARRADLILTGSEHAKKDIVQGLGVPEEKIRVVYHGVDASFRPLTDHERLRIVRKRYALPERFLLFVGMLEPRKNIAGLVKAFSRLCADPNFRHGLVIAGSKGWHYQGVFKEIRRSGLERRVVFTGYVPDEDLCVLYNLADVFVCPSFYEGFGFPILEAMACGTPVITSHVASLPEIGGDAPRYVDPNAIDAMAHAIREVLQDGSLHRGMREKGLVRAREFSWAAAARQTLSVMEAVRVPLILCPRELVTAR